MGVLCKKKQKNNASEHGICSVVKDERMWKMPKNDIYGVTKEIFILPCLYLPIFRAARLTGSFTRQIYSIVSLGPAKHA